jgi:predicted ATP-dependent protease
VEGDSAAAAELYALLSAIAGVPLRQGIGVTGAINQEGLLLPVGGVTHKIEGFFAACRRRGLTGEQGVLMPRRNAQNLVLRREVREAVRNGDFHIWAVDRFEEGWPILAGMEAGEVDDEGAYPEGSVYAAAQDRLAEWARAIQAFSGGGGHVYMLEDARVVAEGVSGQDDDEGVSTPDDAEDGGAREDDQR